LVHRLRHGRLAERVDAGPSAACGRRLLPDGVRAGYRLQACLATQAAVV